MTKKKTSALKKAAISLKNAKKTNLWMVIPISKLPDGCPVLAVEEFYSKDLAKFHLVKNVLFPVPLPKGKPKRKT